MHAWSGDGRDGGDIMGPTVTRTTSGKATTPPLKNGNDLREAGYLIAVGSRTARFRRKHKNKMLLIVLFFLLIILLCLSIVMTVLYVKQRRHKPGYICETTECLRSAANLALSIDGNADPCKDFYQYTCGNWANDHPRPDAYKSYDWFRDKQIKVYTAVRDFLARNTSDLPKPVLQAKDMYAACMDSETLDELGLTPVLEILESLNLPPYPTFINASKDFDYSNYNFDWIESVIKVKTRLGMDVLIGFDIMTDPKNSSVYRLVMGSPETTNPFPSTRNENKRRDRKERKYFKLPTLETEFDETFYEFDDLKSKSNKNGDSMKDKVNNIHKIFYADVMKLFVLESGKIKDDDPDLDKNILTSADEYITIHQYLAELVNDNTSNIYIDVNANLYPNVPEYTVEELQYHSNSVICYHNSTPVPIWKRYLEAVFNMSDVTLDFENDKILISNIDLKYLTFMAHWAARTPPAQIELYIWLTVVEVLAVHSTTDLRLMFHRWYQEVGIQNPGAMPPRGLQCASAVNDLMGMAVSYAIFDPHFVNVTKPKVDTMIYEMKNALAHLVGKVKWMDDNTKLATYQKIIEMKSLIGYPDWFLREGRLEEYYEGVEVNPDTHLVNMINVIVNKQIRFLNSFRTQNNMTWATAPTEVNAFHTFQDNTIRRQFDKNGNFLPWWSNETVDSFVNMTQCFIDQYSQFHLKAINVNVDGKKTLSENIADNGGLHESLTALQHHLKKHGPEPKLPGFEDLSSEQLFFLSYCNLWCGTVTRESLTADLVDEHSPLVFRANGALQNTPEFAKAWNCLPNSPMNPQERCIIF